MAEIDTSSFFIKFKKIAANGGDVNYVKLYRPPPFPPTKPLCIISPTIRFSFGFGTVFTLAQTKRVQIHII